MMKMMPMEELIYDEDDVMEEAMMSLYDEDDAGGADTII